MDAAAIPLPRPETTPPVMKIYFVPTSHLLRRVPGISCTGSFSSFFSKNLFHSSGVLDRVDSDRVRRGVQHRHRHPRRERAELLEAFGALERVRGQARPAPERVLAVAVQAEVLERREERFGSPAVRKGGA